MKFTFVNHASFIIEYKDVRLITDPWLEFTAFDNGWALHSVTQLKYEDFKNITHIWFSHEHPDHFSPPVLKKIPVEYRKNIIVLYQETIDGKVIDFCQKAGFKKVVELPVNKFYHISGDLQCLCNPFSHGDSWIYFKTDEYGVLNVNDCLLPDEATALKIKKEIGNFPVDILFTQFGYANKIGNVDDVHLREKASAEKLDRIAAQQKVFEASYIVPFASYIWFCHQENKYMNEGAQRIANVCYYIENKINVKCVVMYPGQEWIPGEEHSNETAIVKYEADMAKVLHENKVIPTLSLDENVLLENALAYIQNLTAKNRALRLFSKRVKIFVTDFNQGYEFNLNGLHKINVDYNNCDICLSSQALNYSFTNLWGNDTLQVNARFQAPPSGSSLKFFFYGFIAARNNAGLTMTFKNFLVNKVQSFLYHSPW